MSFLNPSKLELNQTELKILPNRDMMIWKRSDSENLQQYISLNAFTEFFPADFEQLSKVKFSYAAWLEEYSE